MSIRPVLWAVLALAPGLALAAPSQPARLVAAQRALEGGVYARTPEAMIKARAELEAISKAAPKSAALHYWLAVADWRLAPRLMDRKPQAQRFVKDGLLHADQALKLDSGMAEALAIKASLLGLSLQLDPSTMMSVGPEIETTMQRALTLAPENPRVVLLDAMGTLHKPEFVGGGAERALPKFKKAQELFATESEADSTAQGWGRFESYVWAGRSAAMLSDKEAARAFYRRALEIQPENGWLRNVLLPELDRVDSTTATGKSDS